MLPSPQATCSLRHLLRQPARVEKGFVFTESARAIADLRVYDSLDTALPLLRDSLIEAGDDGSILLVVRVQVKNVLEAPQKHVWVTVGARWGDERHSAYVDLRRPTELMADIDESKKRERA